MVPRVIGNTIIQARGTSYGSAYLYIPTLGLLEGIWDTEWTSTAKWPSFPAPDPDGWNIIRERVNMIFTDELTGIPDTTGTFEGSAQWKWVGNMGALSSIEVHMVTSGYGDFKGQTLKLSCEPDLQLLSKDVS